MSDLEQMAREWLEETFPPVLHGVHERFVPSLTVLLQHVRDKTWNEATTKDIPAMLAAEYERGCDERDEEWRNNPMTKEHYESIVRERDEEWEKAVREAHAFKVPPEYRTQCAMDKVEALSDLLRRMGRQP